MKVMNQIINVKIVEQPGKKENLHLKKKFSYIKVKVKNVKE
ncbi:hypothetical protein [Clostridium baratii]